jgi:cyclohexadieny/prephenate dehydrogenase
MTSSARSTAFRSEGLLVVGLGLLGASVALAAKRRLAVPRVVGLVRRAEIAQTAIQQGIVDECYVDAAKLPACDFAVICTPIESIPEFVRLVGPSMSAGGIVTDVGSTKATIVGQCEKEVEKTSPGRVFIGSHPMAGGEKGGMAHAREDLFVGRPTILTPTDTSPPEATDRVEQFWRGLGSRIEKVSPVRHDAVVAAISHVPHLVASALAAATSQEDVRFASSGWRDTTRVAGGNPEMWRQILTDNREQVLRSLGAVEQVIAAFREALLTNQPTKLHQLLDEGKRRRDALGN